jgi:hypothetical protein
MHRTVHLSRMKRYTARPSKLETAEQVGVITDNIYQLIDRRIDQKRNRRYLFQPRDDEDKIWLTEVEALKLYTGSDLDTFHALYELKHEDQMPEYAERSKKTAKAPALTREAALEVFPLNTSLSRETDDGSFVEGTIQGYHRPWWRARYDDGVRENLNKTEVLRNIRLRKLVHNQSHGRNREDPSTARLDFHGPLIQQYPDDFRKTYKNRLINFKWNWGWYTGKIIKYMLSPEVL